MKKPSLALFLATLAAASVLSACSPKFDWRDYRSPDAQFTALFPGKPAVLTREIDLDGKKVSLTMTASEVDGNTFAIGSAVLDSAEQAQAALPAMQTALLKNINGTVRSEKSGIGGQQHGCRNAPAQFAEHRSQQAHSKASLSCWSGVLWRRTNASSRSSFSAKKASCRVTPSTPSWTR